MLTWCSFQPLVVADDREAITESRNVNLACTLGILGSDPEALRLVIQFIFAFSGHNLERTAKDPS